MPWRHLGATASDAGSTGVGALAAFCLPLACIVRKFLTTLADEKFVVPICTSMGYAHVLRETGCDKQLVELLVKPLRHFRPLVLPGVVLVAFVVNIPLISQASTAVAAGIVLIPLARAAGLSPITSGAALVLGCSIGGELLNPGAPELRTIVESLREQDPDLTSEGCLAPIRSLIGWHLAAATLVFWLFNRRRRCEAVPAANTPVEPCPPRVNLAKAAVPFLPLVVLLLASGPTQQFQVPTDWLVADPANKAEVRLFESRLIGAAMLLGVAAATLTSPRRIQAITAAFFEGAGFALTYIVGIIVAASCFGEGLKMMGLTRLLGDLIQAAPPLLLPLALALPMLFGLLSGSGMAATQAMFGLFVEPARALGADPLLVGALVSMGAAAGRTMSPVSAVMLMTGQLTETNPLDLFRRVAPPLLVGAMVILVLADVAVGASTVRARIRQRACGQSVHRVSGRPGRGIS